MAHRTRSLRHAAAALVRRMRAVVLFAAAAAPVAVAAAPSDPGVVSAPLVPFTAHYDAYWKSIAVGTSDLKLQRDAEPDHYVYSWTITAHGIFRLVYSKPVVQRSRVVLRDGHVRPLEYHGDDGSSAVDLDFDWDRGYARGSSSGKPVDLKLEDGTLDVMSIQLEIMLSLRRGTLPPTYRIIDNDEAKQFDYSLEGRHTLSTAIGELDTLVVASHRAGSNRILRMWFAPALGYVPVQAERRREGKLEFAMRIKSLAP